MILAEALPLESVTSPLMPTTYDILWSLIPFVQLILALTVLIVEKRRSREWTPALIWALVVLALPLLGFITWLIPASRSAAVRALTGRGAATPDPAVRTAAELDPRGRR